MHRAVSPRPFTAARLHSDSATLETPMQAHRKLIPLQQLLDEDLDSVCQDLRSEFETISGGRLLITGGGGFLGYYLVQAALHWNRTRSTGAKIDVTVYDNYM